MKQNRPNRGWQAVFSGFPQSRGIVHSLPIRLTQTTTIGGGLPPISRDSSHQMLRLCATTG
jgi:hypothetical protein